MIKAKNISKTYQLINGDSIEVFKSVNFEINPNEKVGFLGLNGSGKSTICKIIAGAEPVSSGIINVNCTTSWPIGVFNCLSPQLTALENINFISLAYGVDYDLIVDQVIQYTDLKDFMNKQIRTYSAGMRAKLAFFIAYSINFDIYICDEITAVGDARFREIANDIFQIVKQEKGLVLCSHNVANVRKNVDHIYIIDDGKISIRYPTEEGISIYNDIIKKRNV